MKRKIAAVNRSPHDAKSGRAGDPGAAPPKNQESKAAGGGARATQKQVRDRLFPQTAKGATLNDVGQPAGKNSEFVGGGYPPYPKMS